MKLSEEDEDKMDKLITAIRANYRVKFNFDVYNPETGRRDGSYPVLVEPYRLGYDRGFWYLIGGKVKKGKEKPVLRVFSLYKIHGIEILDEKFEGIPKEVRDIEVFRPYTPSESHPDGVKVRLKVSPEAAMDIPYLRLKPPLTWK